MDSFGVFLVIVILVAIVTAVLFTIWAAEAKQVTEVRSQLSIQGAAQRVQEAFPVLLWKDVPGPGDINKKRRAVQDKGAVISIDLEPDGAGSRAEVWMSEWTSQLGIAHFAGAALRMKKKVVSRLESA